MGALIFDLQKAGLELVKLWYGRIPWTGGYEPTADHPRTISLILTAVIIQAAQIIH
jgi:hypothetical protein